MHIIGLILLMIVVYTVLEIAKGSKAITKKQANILEAAAEGCAFGHLMHDKTAGALFGIASYAMKDHTPEVESAPIERGVPARDPNSGCIFKKRITSN